MSTVHRAFLFAVALIGCVAPGARAQLTIGSVGGAFVPAGGTSSLSTAPAIAPTAPGALVALPAVAPPATVAAAPAVPAPTPRAERPNPSGLLTVPSPRARDPYSTTLVLPPPLSSKTKKSAAGR